jgi:hypothetical protein
MAGYGQQSPERLSYQRAVGSTQALAALSGAGEPGRSIQPARSAALLINALFQPEINEKIIIIFD